MPSGSVKTNTISGQVNQATCNPNPSASLSANPSPPWNVGQTINFTAILNVSSNCVITSATGTLYVNGNASGSFSLQGSMAGGNSVSGTIQYTVPSSLAGSTLSAYAVINYSYTPASSGSSSTGGGGGIGIRRFGFTFP